MVARYAACLFYFSLLSMTAWSVNASSGFRCGNRIVDEGMLAAKVQALCGAPVFRDFRFLSGELRLSADEEDWVYDLGSSRLLRIVTIRRGRVHRIREDGYGLSDVEKGQCRPHSIVDGMSKYRLYALCGEPVQSNAVTVYLPDRQRGVLLGHRPVYREEWVYNFGASSFLRHVILNNGYVVSVESGERGF